MVLEGYERTRVLLRENVLGVTNKGVKAFLKIKKAAPSGTSSWLTYGFVTPHQFEKAKRIAHRMNLAHLIGINSSDWD